MLKRDVSYEDFNGNRQTETFYFNLTKTEMVDWDLDGLAASLQRMIEAKDTQALIQEIKKVVLNAYGERSDDGKRFIKSEELRTAFTQTAAYDALFIELATDDNKLTEFFKGIFPKEFAVQIEQAGKAVLAQAPMAPMPQQMPSMMPPPPQPGPNL